MHVIVFLTLTALMTVVAADGPNAFKVPPGGYKVMGGTPNQIDWEPSSKGTVTLKLQSGSVSGPETGTIIACKYILT